LGVLGLYVAKGFLLLETTFHAIQDIRLRQSR
jgi:hypothetical protein